MPPDHVRTKRKVVPSRRASENASLRRNARPPPPRTKKRQSPIPKHTEHIDLTSNDPPDLEPKKKVSRKSPKPREPLPTKYALTLTVYVDDVRIYSQFKLQTPGAFDYAGFIAFETQKMSDYCDKQGRDVDTRISMVKMVYNKKECHSADIESLEDWMLVDEFAESYLQDRSKKDVQLDWVITYKLKALSVEPEKKAPEPFEDESEDDAKNDDEDAETTHSSKKNTATNQRLIGARADPHSPVMNELLQIYKCQVPGCNNLAHYCFPVGGANSEHYPLTAALFRTWMVAVEDGTATKARRAQKQDPSPPASAPPPPPPYGLHLALPYYSPYPLPAPALCGHAAPYDLPLRPSNQADASKKGVSRPSSSEGVLDLRSLPTDPCTLTSQYIAWYREKFPGQEKFLDNVAHQLKDGAYDLHGLTELRKEDWRSMDIPDGLGRQLARNVTKFKRQRDST
ncbi:MAG: hypothetical protein M1840_003007 [Geoglossum simile]|nr:MAG: hypothetical protein M1840_003007 [Geoglossum simile]